MSADTVFWVAGGIAAVGGALAAFHKVVVAPTLSMYRRLNGHIDAWNGEPARDGFPARTGVIGRLIAIEAELKPNGGASIRDAVTRIERQGTHTSAALAEHMTEATVRIAKGVAAELDLRDADATNSKRLDSIDESLARLESGDTVSGRLVSEAMPVVARATPADIDVHPKD